MLSPQPCPSTCLAQQVREGNLLLPPSVCGVRESGPPGDFRGEHRLGVLVVIPLSSLVGCRQPWTSWWRRT